MWMPANGPRTPKSHPSVGVRGAVAFNVHPHHEYRGILPSQPAGQALLRHLSLEKGDLLWDIKTKALFGSREPTDTVGLTATRGHPAARWPASAHVTIRVPTLPAGSRVRFRGSQGRGWGRGEEWGFVYPQGGLLGLNTPRGGEVKGPQSRQWPQKRGWCGGRVCRSGSPPWPSHPRGTQACGCAHTPAGLASWQKLLRQQKGVLDLLFQPSPWAGPFCSRSYRVSKEQGG